ncbi:MAG: hypothetical protein JWP81_1423 [Ferruginibacter sp.]|nr:hypothetical protein [Ferruginibacter sp.]
MHVKPKSTLQKRSCSYWYCQVVYSLLFDVTTIDITNSF